MTPAQQYARKVLLARRVARLRQQIAALLAGKVIHLPACDAQRCNTQPPPHMLPDGTCRGCGADSGGKVACALDCPLDGELPGVEVIAGPRPPCDWPECVEQATHLVYERPLCPDHAPEYHGPGCDGPLNCTCSPLFHPTTKEI